MQTVSSCVEVPFLHSACALQACADAPCLQYQQRLGKARCLPSQLQTGILVHLATSHLGSFPVDWMHPEYNPHVVYRHAFNLSRQQQAVQTRENLTSTRRTSIKQYANRPVHILEAKLLQAVHNRANITFTRKTQIKKNQQQTCRHL